MKNLKTISRILIAVSALVMFISYYVPIWQILMWAPQYPEGLEMKIWLNTLSGDYKIISGLNHYIGMKNIEVEMFPEFKYMGYIVGTLIGFGLLTALINKRFMLMAYVFLIVGVGVVGMVDFYLWGYDYGHNLDPTAPIIVPGMAYQPPLIGTKQLLNFTAYSAPDIGGYVFVLTGLLAIGCLILELKKKKNIQGAATSIFVLAFLFSSCSSSPEPLRFGEDGCHHCKMTLMDKKFGAELVTTKGKVYKFDDANCLVEFLNNGTLQAADIRHELFIDFAKPGELIDANSAVFVRSEKIKSPMASNVAVFSNRSDAERHNEEWKGQLLTWSELRVN